MPEKKSAAELEQMVLNEVGNHPACEGLTWVAVDAVETTWRVNGYGGDPARPSECMDAINTVVYRLRALYDLSPEAFEEPTMQARRPQMDVHPLAKLVAWCEHQRDDLRRRRELLVTRKFTVHERRDAEYVDITSEQIASIDTQVAEIERLLDEYRWRSQE